MRDVIRLRLAQDRRGFSLKGEDMSEILSKQHTRMAEVSEAAVLRATTTGWLSIEVIMRSMEADGHRLHKSNVQKYLNRLKAAGKVERDVPGGCAWSVWRRTACP